ncbi:50S ribosomal protein L10 [Buchnera aphidicola (Takecallis arundicolens)]|uniref:50S ribosomal protein L10 n=1 Tax=Buchnera aphidicola TaxID=9 RepID=UPI003463BDA0
MALNLETKKSIVMKINTIAKKALSAVIATIKNIPAKKITTLRKTGRTENVFLYVVKHTLLKIALKKTKLKCLNTKIHGSTLIGFSLENPGSVAKIFKKFSQENQSFKIVTAAMHDKILSQTEIHTLANLPSFTEAITHFIITIKTATIGQLFSTLLEIKKKKIISK